MEKEKRATLYELECFQAALRKNMILWRPKSTLEVWRGERWEEEGEGGLGGATFWFIWLKSRVHGENGGGKCLDFPSRIFIFDLNFQVSQ